MTESQLEERIRKEGIPITLSGWVKEADAARVIGVHVSTLKRYVLNGGDGPAYVKRNTRRHYTVAALADYLTKCEQPRPTPSKP